MVSVTAEGVRARVRAELTEEIKAVARRHLAESGAAALSLRAVARDVGMVSSAVYRYFPSRDDLLTALIVDSYLSLGAEVHAAAQRRGAVEHRFLACGHAVREWAVARPHEWALLFGSPVPGYAAPEDTVDPAAVAPLALLGVVAEGVDDGRDHVESVRRHDPCAADMARLRADTGLDIPDDVLVRALGAWATLIGARQRRAVRPHQERGHRPRRLLRRPAARPSGRRRRLIRWSRPPVRCLRRR